MIDEAKPSVQFTGMNCAPGRCADCEKLSADYESATIRWFRLESQMLIAEFSLDRDACSRIRAELAAATNQRQALRDALHHHVAVAHAENTRAFAA